MTNEERDLITQFVGRVAGPPAGGGGFAGSVPQVGAQPLPPIDPQADALLADLFARYPEARYRITQFAFVQEHAVAAAQNQIKQLQAQIQQLQAQMQAPAQAAPSPWGAPAQPQMAAPPPPSRSLLGSLFGSSQPAPQPYPQQAYAPPPPQYAPGYSPGMFQGSGSGFLGSALRTATGVAGGVLAADALSSLFSGGHHEQQNASFGGGFAPQQSFPGEAAPWAGPAASPYDAGDLGGDAKTYAAPEPQDSGWTDSSSSSDSGWSDSGSSDPNQ
jgi:hypothetical protein